MEPKDFVNVGVRIRPGLNGNNSSSSVSVINESPPILCVNERNLTYSFDHIFPEDTPQKYVYEKMVEPLVRKVKCGYNCTVFAYGQTGTGKTYTMGSNPDTHNPEHDGFISRTLDDFFVEDSDAMALSVSFFEIYNEKVYDLLNEGTTALCVKGFKIDGLQEVPIKNKMEAYELLKMGSKKRHVSEMKQNSQSSRSHAIFTIYCCYRRGDDETKAKLNLVDLAGSESVRRTESRGSQFHEGVNINKGLFYVGQVISALSTNSHVPYRQSVITSILQDSLSKKNYVTLIACISPDKADIYETVYVLDFAQKVKKIKNKPEITSIIKEYKEKNSGLFNNPGSAMRPRKTPSKRIHSGNTYQTPLFKMPRVETVAEVVNSSGLDSPRSLFSMSLSSISDMPVNFSPVIKKYFNAFEMTVMEKMQSLVKDTLDWDKLQSTVARVVKSEINQAKTKFACSSPNEIDVSGVEKTLSPNIDKENASPNSNQIVPKKLFEEDKTVVQTDDEIFKMPVVPFKQPNKKRTPQKNLRRSVRLSLKAADADDCGYNSRFSVAPKNTPRPTPAPRQRIQTPKPTPRKKTVKDANPKITHSEHVLNILNEGTEKELQTLATIGVKTAKQIVLYREINGTFNSLDDLEKMPWRGNMLSRFKKANFL